MTNTHVNFGGHKVTTNKVGSVHSITTLLNGFTFNDANSRIRWCVTNGLCYVEIWGVVNPAANGQIVVTDQLPKVKLSGATYAISGKVFYVLEGGTHLVCQSTIAQDSSYASIVYPVADDWNE